ncbi:MAG: rRNA pseudouridine synthase, partial [Candidatus Omnitrophica bacterium]|nr:rRNA pseudouridine synthase [Candidatus Omnitrophota bacterium]
MRLQVFLSHNGVCSRRKAMALVQSGQVTVDGTIVNEPSFEVDENKHAVHVNGKEVNAKALVYLLLNKTKGVVTSRSGYGQEATIYSLLPEEWRHLSPVGRLDKDTEGLLILTNDGDLNFALTHPKFLVDKTYFAIVRGGLKKPDIERMERGIMLDGKKTSPAKMKHIRTKDNQTEFEITIHEGRKRQIRLMFAKIHHPVVYLKRIQQGPITLGALKSGAFRRLTSQE